MSSMTNNKLNAAGMSPEHSMVLPERQPREDEVALLDAIAEIYTSPQPNPTALQIFAPDVIYSSPKGDVYVGHAGVQHLLASTSALASASASASAPRKLHHRLLQTPDTLAPTTIVLDQTISIGDDAKMSRSLIVLKRRPVDGLITHLTEEEGHRRATAPLAARAASASNFYSPTDNMLSPCTSKLNLVKKKNYSKAKPMNLFAAQQAANASKMAQRGRENATSPMEI